MTAVLAAAGLTVVAGGRAVLDGVTFEAPGGVPVALTGPSGSGKTALLLALAGVLAPAAGTVTLDGVPVTGGDLETGRLCLVAAGDGLAPELSAGENVALPLQTRGLPRPEVAARRRQALAAVGLDGVDGRLVGELSGGQRQRVAVARALAARPVALLADEPTAELDPVTRAAVLDVVLAGAPVVVVATNDPEVVARCPRVLVMSGGTLAG